MAVLESVSLTSAEAIEYGLIDLIATDPDDLLALLDTRYVVTAAGTVTLTTSGASLIDTPMHTAERLLHRRVMCRKQ